MDSPESPTPPSKKMRTETGAAAAGSYQSNGEELLEELLISLDSACRCGTPVQKGTLDRIVQILQANPQLAQRRYKKKRTSAKPLALPFSFLAKAPGATVEQVKVVYELYPEAIKDDWYQNGRRGIPIFMAISNLSSPDIIEFLARAYPASLEFREYGDSGFLPIGLLLGRLPGRLLRGCGASEQHVQVISTFLDLYPQSVTESGAQELLWLAIHTRLEQAVDLILERMPKDFDIFNLPNCRMGLPTGLAIKAIAVLLPQLREIYFPIVNDDTDTAPAVSKAFALLTQSLQQVGSTKLERLHFKSPLSESLETTRPSLMRGLIQMLTSKSNYLRHLHLEGQSGWHASSMAAEGGLFTEAIIKGSMSPKNRLSSLHLEHAGIPNAGLLSKMITSKKCPRNIYLVECLIPADAFQDTHLVSNIEGLFLRGTRRGLQKDAVRGLSHYASVACPSLKNLEVHDEESNDSIDDMGITENLLKIAAKPSLEELRISYTMPLSTLLSIVKLESPLRKLQVRVLEVVDETKKPHCELLKVLEKKNTLLEQLCLGRCTCNERFMMRASYWLCLNEYGRGKARDPSTTKREYVKMLAKILTIGDRRGIDYYNRKFAAVSRDPCHAILYGMLRENPGLWAKEEP